MIDRDKNTFDIPESNMERLTHEVAKLNKRANKIGCPPLTISTLREFLMDDPNFPKSLNPEIRAKQVIPQIRMFEVEIVGEGPKIEGHRFIGTLDHYTIPGSVIVNAVPGETVPMNFFKSTATCHHCDKIRSRVETFVVYNEKEDVYKQVGRNCLRDFFGHDPSVVARFLTRVINFCNTIQDDWGFKDSVKYIHHLNSLTVLTTTVAVIRTHGWVPRSAADSDHPATADLVSYVMTYRPMGDIDAAELKRFKANLKHDDNDEQESKDAIAWLKEQKSDNSYMHNLVAIESVGSVPTTMLGYWCSLISTYQNTWIDWK